MSTSNEGSKLSSRASKLDDASPIEHRYSMIFSQKSSSCGTRVKARVMVRIRVRVDVGVYRVSVGFGVTVSR